ncbi:DUF4330 domain-containing protein [Tissierella sp. Yu-01]|uniref:DUF4330 domain-containing protein n=1 Tax=Tissierella sp. Yu-01 TaxID=3035694 RepID=UPI00240D513A|nr:DUF4330 domain-containing protein [Tissierella sp. Yu-01]WFA09129.1 DUF4330 domain-containing protein [Tissierella sp. Yu-01]
MKLIDDKGRIFNKINILDLLFIVLILFLVFLSVIKIFGANLEDLTATDENVNIEFTASIVMDKGYLDVINVGDQLGETKQFLDAYIEDVEVVEVMATNLDQNGNEVVSVDPTMEKAEVVISANVPYKNMSYKLGNQELRQGKIIFLESQFYRYKAQIESVKVVN